MATSSQILRLHILEQEGRGYDEKDVDSVASQTQKWQFNIIGMMQQIENFTVLHSLLFGKERLQCRNLGPYDSQILKKKEKYERKDEGTNT